MASPALRACTQPPRELITRDVTRDLGDRTGSRRCALLEGMLDHLTLVRRSQGLDGSPATPTDASHPRQRVETTRRVRPSAMNFSAVNSTRPTSTGPRNVGGVEFTGWRLHPCASAVRSTGATAATTVAAVGARR
ncbi:MAG: hypothetical protein JO115_19765 [Pseudonocardiales bacterium]|nr:hypothetical protein [Pseudonocardiales bacterium]